MSSCSANHPKNLHSFFEQGEAFQLHTGNINEWLDLRFKGFQNSQEELRECLKLQLERWNPKDEGCQCPATNMSLCQNDRCNPSVEGEPREDLKITLKLFITDLKDFENQVEAAIQSVLRELETTHVEQLIISFPDITIDAPNDATEEQVAQVWLDSIKPIWLKLERLVEDEHHSVTLGVADLDVSEMRALYEWAPSVKPEIDHYNIQGCCSVPSELQAYAREKDIALLTHNDPRDFPGKRILGEVCTKSLGLSCDSLKKWQATWAARYTVLIRTRSVVTKKGYIVRFATEAPGDQAAKP